MSLLRLVISLGVLVIATTSHAQVIINEVQISPIEERFIELHNTSGSDVDLTGWYIQRKTATGSSFNSLITKTDFENKTILAGGYFLVSRGSVSSEDIIKDNLVLTESNILRIRNASGEDVDQIQWGSLDEGKSYQKTNSGWVESAPTPGAVNLEAGLPNLETTTDDPPPTPPSTNDTENNSQVDPPVTQTVTQTSSGGSSPIEPQIFTSAGKSKRIVVVGADVLFEGKTVGVRNQSIESTIYLWSFGDGSSKEGKSVYHNYKYPGEYILILDSFSGRYSSSIRIMVSVVPADVRITNVGDEENYFIEVTNGTAYELDVSGWKLSGRGRAFIFPENTILLADYGVKFPSEHTGIKVDQHETISLIYPNGNIVHQYTGIIDKDVSIDSIIPKEVIRAEVKAESEYVSEIKETISKEVEIEKEILIPQIASVLEATPETGQKGSLYRWILGLVALILLAIFGVLYSKDPKGEVTEESGPNVQSDKEDQSQPAQSEADEYEIIEDPVYFDDNNDKKEKID